MHLSLEVTLQNGSKKVSPLSYRAIEHFDKGAFTHESQIPCMSRVAEALLDDFTGVDYSWELAYYHYVEGCTTTGELDCADSETYGGNYEFKWQILLNDKPATYEEVEQYLNGVQA
jgi:hypothetical protein